MADSDDFYASLPTMTDFDQFSEFDAYTPVPDDWVVLCGDIVGSTAAIAQGQYKTVNMLGAAVITSVLNACGDVAVPYVFGGDGGTIAVPGHLAEGSIEALRRLQAHSLATFGLTMRAAAFPVRRIRRDGLDIRVRRYALNADNHLAMFAGGGVAYVDDILKSADTDDSDIIAPDPDATPPDLDGLSCRWEPLDATHGRMIALMVQPLGGDMEARFQNALQRLTEILDRDIPSHAPANDASLRFRWPPRGLWLEAKAAAGATSRIKPYLWGLFTALMQKLSHSRGVQIGDYDGPSYLEQLKAQTDFRKFDGCLRVVLDCTEAQVTEISDWLEDEYRQRSLVYGLHVGDQAVMTCLVFSLKEGEHIHFVDAAGGGFANASSGFKDRMAQVRRERRA